MIMDEHDRFLGRSEKGNHSPSVSMADFDEAQYLPYLDGLDIEDSQARELLRTLWDIMRMCVEMNAPPESCEQIVSSIFTAAAHSSGDVE